MSRVPCSNSIRSGLFCAIEEILPSIAVTRVDDRPSKGLVLRFRVASLPGGARLGTRTRRTSSEEPHRAAGVAVAWGPTRCRRRKRRASVPILANGEEFFVKAKSRLILAIERIVKKPFPGWRRGLTIKLNEILCRLTDAGLGSDLPAGRRHKENLCRI